MKEKMLCRLSASVRHCQWSCRKPPFLNSLTSPPLDLLLSPTGLPHRSLLPNANLTPKIKTRPLIFFVCLPAFRDGWHTSRRSPRNWFHCYQKCSRMSLRKKLKHLKELFLTEFLVMCYSSKHSKGAFSISFLEYYPIFWQHETYNIM